jgi:hypothetical protein
MFGAVEDAGPLERCRKMDVPMYGLKRAPRWFLTTTLTGLLAACSLEVEEGRLSGTIAGGQSSVGQSVTLFEGARLVVGDGSTPIENSAFLVQGTRFVRVGRARSTLLTMRSAST